MSLELTAEALALYHHMARGSLVWPLGTPGLTELVEKGLAVRNPYEPDLYLLADQYHVYQTHVERDVAVIAAAAARLLRMPDAMSQLPQVLAQADGSCEYMADKAEANAEIIKALAGMTSHVWTAHPIDRAEGSILQSLPRDIDNLKRNLGLRTIYANSARNRPHMCHWAEQVTEHGAEVRTLPGGFMRMIIVDDVFVLLSDYRPGADIRGPAWKITHPGLVAAWIEVYRQQWHRAEPWMGGHVRPAEKTLTTTTQRRILRLMSAGHKQPQIASELGVTSRTVSAYLAPLYDKLGIAPGDQFRLGEFWRETQERFLD
ncbi:LuxR C-terminal-related transcriptional regulator [Streptomyces sp. NPDC057445]|uniref:helix-turn-helix transcriptional regulator n=1 Tax=Streptomyces sp. NPDC057445 TaxID=3346136 RepID=UPI0036CEC0FA